MTKVAKEDYINKIYNEVEISNTSKNEIKTVLNKKKDIYDFYDENQESLYPIKEKVEGLENYLEYLEKLEYELNEVKSAPLKKLIDNPFK